MKRTYTASLLILLGFSILLANLNIGNSRELFENWWPVFVIALGGTIWLNDHRNYLWALFVTLLGVGLLINSLALASFNLGDFILPAILVVFGISLLTRTNAQKQVATDSSDNITAILAGVSSKNTSKDFKGAKVTAIMGGVEIDLSKATIKKGAALDVSVLMGSVELRVPENVIVKNRAFCLLGGIEDKSTPQDSKDAPILYIDGTIIMGGVEIKR